MLYEKDTSGETWWCNSHNRRATHIGPQGHHCDPDLGGILLPCFAVNLTGLIEIEEKTMSEDAKMHDGLPVKGYKAQPASAVATVNLHKEMEEQLLRIIDAYKKNPAVEKRWLNIARTDLEKGFMALNRAIFQPGRVALPSDTENATPPQGGGPDATPPAR